MGTYARRTETQEGVEGTKEFHEVAQASSRKMRRPKPVLTFFCIIALMSAWYLPGTVITPAFPHCSADSSLSSVAGSNLTQLGGLISEWSDMRSGLSSQYQATLDLSYLITGGGLDTWGPLCSRITRRA